MYDDYFIKNAVLVDDSEDYLDDTEQSDEYVGDINDTGVDLDIVVNEISITVNIKEVDQARILASLGFTGNKSSLDMAYYLSTNGVYVYYFSKNIGDEQRVIVECDPICSKTPFMRLSWDPSKVDMEALITWQKEHFGEKYTRKILLESHVSKISGFTVIGTHNYDCLIFKNKAKKSAIEWENGSHRIIKQTIGDEKGRTFITLWNTSTVRQKEFFGTTELREHELSITLKSTKSSILEAYSMLMKEFDGLEFYSTQIIYDVILDPAIIAILVSNGMNAGFYQFDLSKRYTLKEYFMQYKEDNIDTSENSVRAAWESAFGSFNGYEL